MEYYDNNTQQPNTQQDKSEFTAGLLFNEEVETRVLTCILQNNRCYYQAAGVLNDGLFHNPKNAKIFNIIKKGVADGKVVDNVYVAQVILRNPDNEGYTAQDVLIKFSAYVTDALIGQDIEYLMELKRRHDFWVLGQKLIRIGSDMAVTPEMALGEINKVIDNDSDKDNGVISMKDANRMMMEKVDANISGTSDTYLETGFAYLDDNGGFQTGDFDVIAADSSAGKTALSTKIMCSIASKGDPCMSYSMEMRAEQLSARINSPQSKIPSSIIQYKKLTESQYRNLQNAVTLTDDLPIYFDDKSTTSADAILASIRLNARRLGIKFFVVDYLQILSSIGMVENQEKFLGEISRRFKNLAKELQVNITVLSQLARNNQDPRPTLARVRASGQIVEAADTVLLIWRPSMYGRTSYKDNNAPVENTAEIIVGKGRNIGTGSFVVHFDPTTTNFYDATPEERRTWGAEFYSPSANNKVDDDEPPLPLDGDNDPNAPF